MFEILSMRFWTTLPMDWLCLDLAQTAPRLQLEYLLLLLPLLFLNYLGPRRQKVKVRFKKKS